MKHGAYDLKEKQTHRYGAHEWPGGRGSSGLAGRVRCWRDRNFSCRILKRGRAWMVTTPGGKVWLLWADPDSPLEGPPDRL